MALAAAAAVALACSKGSDAGPRLRSIEPAQGAAGTAVTVRIEGEGLEPHVLTDYGDEGASLVDTRFQAWLGTSRLRDVRPTGDGSLSATVPEDLPAGTYELAVEDPGSARATLPAAFRVLAPSDAGALVASFRIDPVAGQVARTPFSITVTALDASGQVVTGFSGTAAISDRTGALVPASIGPFAWGVWTGPVEVRAPLAADALTVADGLGHGGTSNDFAVVPAPAARVVFTSPAVDTVAGACAGPVAVALEDLYGAPTAATAPVDVAVAGAAVGVYADPACAVSASVATIPAGATSATVYVGSTLAAPFVLDATAAALAPDTQPGVVRPAAPGRLVFTTPPQAVAAGSCSAAAAVRAEDAYGNVSPAPADTAVALSSTAAAGLTFHDAAGCAAAAVPAVTLPAGGSTATFWFRGTGAQAITVTAAGAGIAGAGTQGETILPTAPVALAFVTASQTVAAGSCSGAATVEARDAFGNAAPVPAGALVALASAPAAPFTFHLDPACADAPVAATVMAPGASQASFRFRATATGLYDVSATGGGLPGVATQAETIGPAAADRVVFTSAAKTPKAGQCSGPLTVEVRDGLGNAAPVAASTVVALTASPSAGTQLYASADCTGPAGGPATIPAGAAATTFSFRSTAAGTFDATATVAGLLPGTQAETVQPEAPDRLVFTTAPITATAGSCSSALTVEARDAYGNVAPVAALTAVSLGAAPGTGFSFFGAAGCGAGPVTSVDVAAGASSATFWFRGTAAGVVTVTATGAGIPTVATQPETILPDAPDRLVFTTAPQTLVAGTCSGAATVEALDVHGNVAPVAGLTNVALSAAPGTGFAFFDTAGCGGAPVASVDLAAGAATKTFWFRGTASGTETVTAAGAGIPTVATQAETIVPAPPDRLVFTTAPQTLVAGTCSGAATVEALDVHGNVAPVAGLTNVALSAAPGTGFAFFDTAGCGGAPVTAADLAAGAATKTFWFRGTASGTETVTAAGAGIPTVATQAETIVPAAPDRLVFTTAPQTLVAGACSGAATVEALDVHGNVAPVAALTAIPLSAAPGTGFAFFDTAGCGGAPVTSVDLAAGGSSKTFWFQGTAAGVVTVTATGAGIPTAATQAESVVPGAPDRLVFTTAPQTLVAGTCSGAATVEALDVHGNVAPVAGLTSVALSAAPATGFAFFDTAGCGGAPVTSVDLAAGASSRTFWFRGTAAGTVTVSATGAGIPAAATQPETIVPAPPDRLVFTTAPQTLVAGSCSAAATVEALDVHGNVAPVAVLTAIALSAAPGTGFAFFDTAGCGGAPVTSIDLAAGGSSRALWFRGTAAGVVTVTATGAGIPAAATQAETILPAAPDRLVFTTAPQTVVAGTCSGAATVEALDVHGNVAPVAAITAIALSAAPGAGFAFFDTAGCGGAPVASVDLAAGGSSRTFWFRGTAAGVVTVTATGAGIPAAATQAETVNPAAPDRLVFTTAPQTLVAGTCSGAATVEALDVHGNVAPVAALTAVALSAAPGTGLAFFDTAGCGSTAVTSVDLAAGASSKTFWFRGTAAGTVTVTATGAGIPTTATQSQTIVPAAPDRLVFTTAPQTLTAGACSGAATVEALDVHGNVAPVAALTTVALSATPGTGFAFFDTAGCGSTAVTSVDLAAGASSRTFWFRGTAAGTVTVTANGAGIPAAASQAESIVPGAPDRLVFTTAPQTVTAGTCSGAATVESLDVHGNVAPVAALTAVALSAAPGTGFAFFDGAGCGGAPVTSVDLSAGASSRTFSFRGTAAGVVTVGATGAGIPTAAAQVETIVPAAPDRLVFITAPQTLVAGSCSGAATVEALDVHGNVAPVAALTNVALSAAPATGFAFFDTAGCGSTAVASVDLAAGASSKTFWFRGTAAGTATVTATGAGIPTAAAQAQTIVPAPPDRLVFTTAPQTLVAGTCSGAATVEALDVHGNVAPVAALTPIALAAAPATGFAFFDTAGCGGAPVTSVDLAAGAATRTFWFRGTAAGAVTVTATGAGIPTAATQSATIIPAAPDRLVFTTAAQSVTAGTCSGAATVEALDVHGNVAPVAALTTVALSAAPGTGFAFFDTAGCGSTAVASVDLAAGASSRTFWFRGTAASAVTVTATGAGIPTAASQGETILPAAPDRLVFTTVPQTLTAGSCSGAATVTVLDTLGNVAPVSALTAVALAAAPATGFQFFGTAGCGGPALTSVNLAAGTSSQTFWFRGTAAGGVTVTATGAGLPTPATQAETVDPAAPAAVVFTSPPQTVTAGSCSAAARIELRDAFGNVTADPGAPIALALAAAPVAGFELFEDPACAVAVAGAAIAIPAGSAGKDFWFKGTLAATVTLTSAPASLAAASQLETIGPAAPDRLVFTTGTQTVTAGACSAAATVQSRDVHGNVAPVAALTSVALAAAPGAGFQFFDTAGCGGPPVTSVGIAVGASSQTFWFRGTAAGGVTVTATGAGIPTAASQGETIPPAAPDRLVFASPPQTLVAGICSAAASLETRDLYGNVAPAAALTSVALAAAPAAGFQFFDTAGCGGAPVASIALAAGASSQTFWFRGTAAGTVTVTATGAGIPTAATQAETIQPAAPDRLVFTSSSQTVTAGTCSAALAVEARDVHGNVAPVAALTSIALAAAPATGFQFFDTAGCGGAPVTSVSLAAGASSQTFWFSGTAAGAVTVTATGAGIPTPATQADTVKAAAPDRLVYTSAPQVLAAGACSAGVAVEARDVYGNVAPVAALTSVALAAAPGAGFQFFGTAGCGGAPLASVNIAAGASSATFWFRGTAAGSVTVTATGAGIPTAAAQVEDITSAPPDRVVFTTGAQTVQAGACSGVTRLELRDPYANATAGAADASLALGGAPAPGTTFYEDPGCVVPVAGNSIVIPAGQVGKDFWFTATAAGPLVVTSAPALLASASQTETISAAAPARLVFTTGAQSLTAGTCSAVATVQAQDTYGNVSTVAGNTAISLAAAPAAGFAFYAAAGCGGPTTASVTILAGQSTASFYFRGTATGSVTVTATGTGIPTAATQAQPISAAAPARLVFTTGAQSLTAGTCSAVASVQAQDTYGNVSTVAANTAVSLAAAPAAGFNFYAAAGCGGPTTASVNILAGQSSASFYFRGTATGSVTITATGTGIATPASQAQTISAAAPAQLVFTTGAQSLTAGTCSAVATVQSQDTYGNVATVAANTAVSLAAAPAAGFNLYAAAGCGGPTTASVTILAGQSSASFYFRGTATGSVTVTATGTGIATPASQAQTISAAAPAQLVFTTGAQSLTAGTCSAVATVQSQDTYGNVSTVAANTAVSLAAAPAAGFTFYAAAGCGGPTTASVTILAGQSSASFYFRGTATGSVTITATGTGIATPASQAQTISAAAPARLVFTTGAQSLTAGTCSAVASVQAQDTYGNVATVAVNTAVSLAAAPAAGFNFYAAAGCGGPTTTSVTILAGQSSASFYFRGTATGSVTITATGTGIATPASQAQTISAAAPARLVFTTGAQSLTAGTCSAVATVQSQDTYGNVSTVAANTAVSLAAAPAAGFTFYAAAGCGGPTTASVTILAGQSSASFYFRGTATGSVTITATGTGIATPASQAQTISAAAPARLVFTTGAQSLTAGTCSAVASVQAQDTYGNVATVAVNTAVSLAAAPAAGFNFYAAAGCGGPTTTSVTILAGQSTASFYFRGTAAGSVTVTATGTGIATPASQAQTISAAAPAQLVFTTGAQSLTAGTCSAVATVQAQDTYGNVSTVAANTAISLAAAPAAGFAFYAAAGCGGPTTASVTILAGQSTASFYFRGTATGSVTVTATGTGIPTAATQAQPISAAAPARLVFTTGAQSLTAGTCSAVASVQAQDTYGNVSTVAANTAVSLAAAPAAGFNLYAAAGCGGPTTASVTILAGQSSASFYFRGTATGSVTITATGTGIATPASQAQTISAAAPAQLVFTTGAQSLTAGTCSAVATVQAQDTYGNVSTVAANTAVSLAAAPAAGFTFYAAAGCGGPTTASVTILAGQSSASFYFRGTATGSVTVTATGAGIPTAATQPETVNPGTTDHFVFDPVSSPSIRTQSYALRAQAVDLYGNLTPAFTSTATLSLTVPQPPNGAGATLSCTAGCASGTVTNAFAAGVWTGSAAVNWADPDLQKLGVSVRAAGSGAYAAVTGSSGAFDVAVTVKSPPTAVVRASPVVIQVNQAVTFDASGSTDYQTAAASLQVSWDLQGTSTAAPAYPTPAVPWTAWTTIKTASNTYTVAGTYQARVAVRDADGDVGYGSVTVVVLPLLNALCIVTTAADVDDGATSCAAPGPDGVLSLAEALRVAPGGATVTFASPYTISGTGAYTISTNLTIVAPAGTILDGKSLTINGSGTHIYGLELANQATAVVVGNKKTVTLEDCYLHDMPGITDYGTLTLTRVRMRNCVGGCVFVTDSSNSDTLTTHHSTFLGGAAAVGIDVAQCRFNKVSLAAQSNVFAGLAIAVRFGNLCTGPSDLRNNSFVSNGTGIAYPTVATSNHVLRNTIFSGHTTASVSCGLATFASRDYHLTYQNASDACIAGDPNLISGADPLYLFAAADDYRVAPASPAVNSALDLGLFLLPQYPATAPRFLGAGPDLGGRESW